MSADLAAAAALIAASLVLARLLRIRPLWPAVPFIILSGRVALDAGLSPLVAARSGWPVLPIVGSPSADEIPAALFLVVLSYLSVAAGVWLGMRITRGGRSAPSAASPDAPLSAAQYARAWRASEVIFALGLLGNAVILASLLRSTSLLDLATTRALFSDEAVGESPFFFYAAWLSPLTQIGALGLLLFGAQSAQRRTLAVWANVATLGLHALYGGRGGVVKVALTFSIAYYFAVPGRPSLRALRALRLPVILAAAGLAYVYWGRFEGSLFEATETDLGLVSGFAADLLVSGDVAETAFAARNFPSAVPFVSGASVLAGLAHLAPGLSLPGATNLWDILVQEYYEGESPVTGRGGFNLALAAEHYINNGLLGVVLYGAVLSIPFGLVFGWHARHPRNPFAVLTAAPAMAIFLATCAGRMAFGIASLGTEVILPVALLATIVLSRRRESELFRIALALLVAVFAIWVVGGRTSGLAPIKYAGIGLFFLLYLASFRVLGSCTRPLVQKPPRRAHGLP